MKHIATLGLALGLASTATLAEAQLSTTTTAIPGTTSTTSSLPAPTPDARSGSGATTRLGPTTGLEHTMTGCLLKWPALAGAYYMTNTAATSPRTIGIINPPSYLATLLGHKVTIKGYVPSSAELAAAEYKGSAEHYMKLSSGTGALTSVAATCP